VAPDALEEGRRFVLKFSVEKEEEVSSIFNRIAGDISSNAARRPASIATLL
jgi:hypothetical protein